MKTIKVKLYQFKELPKRIKEKVLEKMRYINVEHNEWDDMTLDEWTGKLEGMGYDNVKILYSGFGSQGDGACFTATVDVEKYIKKINAKARKKYLSIMRPDELTITIQHTYNYYFASSTSVDWDTWGAWDEKKEEKVAELVKLIEKEREGLGNAIYHDLEEAYYALIEDKAVIETIELNEYDFFANGKLY